jgi:hypothetical protein
VRRVRAQVVAVDAGALRLRWQVDGAQALVLPPAAGSGRADGLWKTTCFEAFLQPDAQPPGRSAYVELNLSPSGRWNAYDFDAYRAGMAPRALPCAPELALRIVGDGADRALTFDAAVPRAGLPPLPCRLGLAAVIEEHGQVKSYWALVHPAPDAPDFHAAAGFRARLDAPREDAA